MVGDAIDFYLVLKIDGAVGRPKLRIEPRGLFPRRRVAAVNADKDDLRLLDCADQRGNLPFELGWTAGPR